MKFIIERKGETYMVLNDTSGDVRSLHKTEGEAKLAAKQYQKTHDTGIASVSARMTPPAAMEKE